MSEPKAPYVAHTDAERPFEAGETVYHRTDGPLIYCEPGTGGEEKCECSTPDGRWSRLARISDLSRTPWPVATPTFDPSVTPLSGQTVYHRKHGQLVLKTEMINGQWECEGKPWTYFCDLEDLLLVPWSVRDALTPSAEGELRAQLEAESDIQWAQQTEIDNLKKQLAAERETNAILTAALKPIEWDGGVYECTQGNPQCLLRCDINKQTLVHAANCALDAAFKEIERRKTA